MNAKDEFDSYTEVIGDDIVVGGVAYSRDEWIEDPEDGVRRRGEEDHVLNRLVEEADMARDFRERAKQVAADFVAVATNVSTGPRLSDLMNRYSQLISDAEDAGFDTDIIRGIVHPNPADATG